MNSYHFVTEWRVAGTCGEVADVLKDPVGLARWWPSVYLETEELEPANAAGVGRRVRVLTKGWLPYTLRWEFVVTESRYPSGFTIQAVGDFVGRGEWTFVQEGPVVKVTYDWTIAAEKPLLKLLTPVLRPAFEANHRWAMAQGETSLKLELARRRAGSDAARAAIPPPPGPVTYAAVALIGGAAVVGGTLAYLLVRAHRKAHDDDEDA
jgi:polyketide cyclase/dehydrase/lipid transport protein